MAGDLCVNFERHGAAQRLGSNVPQHLRDSGWLMGLFFKRRKQDFTTRAAEYLSDQAQFHLIGLLYEATTFDERVAEGRAIFFAGDDEDPMTPGYVVLSPTELLWAHTETMQVNRAKLSESPMAIGEAEEAPFEGWALVSLMADDLAEAFLVQGDSHLQEALENRVAADAEASAKVTELLEAIDTASPEEAGRLLEELRELAQSEEPDNR